MFHNPIWLWALLALPLIGGWIFRPGSRGSVPFSDLGVASSLVPTWRQRMAWLPGALFLLGLALVIVSLAGPREGREQTITQSEGIAIELVVDRSGSMRAMDFRVNEQPVDRLTAIKDVAERFVLGDTSLDGRFSDLVGLVTFAGKADGLSPPTLDHPFVMGRLNATEIVSRQTEDGTAIGDAIGLATEKLATLEERPGGGVQSKVIILLTDGENNAGDLDPIQAAELAQMLGIRIYTIGVGTRGQAPVPDRDPFSGRIVTRWMNVNIDEATLQQIADATGGRYFRATDTESLAAIYKEIDELEKTTVEEAVYTDYRELAVQPFEWQGWTLPPIGLLALFAFAGHTILKQTIFRELV